MKRGEEEICMGKQYGKERKEAVLRKMSGGKYKISVIAKEEQIPEGTLHYWRHEARKKGLHLPNGSKSLAGWSSHDKFQAVVESSFFNEHERAAYCRKKGIDPVMLEQWRNACIHANNWDEEQARIIKSERQEARQRVNELERELRRKEKALAEAAALLVLQKKLQAIWGETGDE